MKLLQINIDHDITAAEFEATAGETANFAKIIAAQPGLLWKIWIGSQARSEVGGVYLFDSAAAAETFVAGPVFAQIKGNPRFQKVEAKLFDVNESASLITRAPLPASARV